MEEKDLKTDPALTKEEQEKAPAETAADKARLAFSAAGAATVSQSADGVLGEAEETYKEMSPIRLVLRRFFRSKLSIVGLVMIVFLFLFSFLGPVVYNV